MYRFVYYSKTGFLVALLMLISFFLQGVQNVYANEVIPVTESETSLNEVVGSVFPDAVNGIPSSAEEVPEIIPDTDIHNEGAVLDETASEADPRDFNIDSTSTSTASITEIIEAESDDSGIDDSDVEPGEVILDQEQEMESDSIKSNNESINITNSDSAFSFTKDECTELATGSFYCLQPQENILKDALFSAPDADGDMEIFFVKDGVQSQITQNLFDDAAPYYDQNTNTIVWHRLIDDRYQVVVYEVDTNEERQLTSDSSNNMEPNRQGDYFVWQRWVDGGWNIILLDGKEEIQITKTTSHNVAPYIHGSLVVWNRHAPDGNKTIEMYDIASRAYVTVEDPDGLSVSNPRMVFVYDSLHPNGDIVTKGYDLLAKKFIQLDSLPRDLPDEIPPADSTGETRALIQSKPATKSEVEDSIDDGSTNQGPGPGPKFNGSDTSSSSTPFLTPGVSPVGTEVTATADMVLDLSVPMVVDTSIEIYKTEFDLFIPGIKVSDHISTLRVKE